LQQKCIVQQEAANYVEQKCIVQQEVANYVHADPRSREAKEVEALLRRLHLRYKAAALEARIRVLHSAI
jgi:hypothetical protein